MREDDETGSERLSDPLDIGEDAFLSYSRKDKPFVEQIYQALQERGFHTWVDWEGIPPSDEWLRTIREGIDRSQIFVFALSPSSVASGVCVREELRHAIEAQKKIIPVVVRDFSGEGAPEEHVEFLNHLKKLNYVFLRKDDDFEEGISKLVEAFRTDLDHVRAHTGYLLAARIWDSEDRPKSRLFRGDVLRVAQEWLSQVGSKEPSASQLQIDFIQRSGYEEIKRRRRGLLAGIVATLVLVLLALTFVSRQGQAMLALSNRGASNQNLAMRHLASVEFPQTQFFAARALQNFREAEEGGRIFTLTGRVTSADWLEEAMENLELLAKGEGGSPLAPMPVWCATVPENPRKVNRVIFGPGGRWIGAAGDDGYVRIWDWNSPKPLHELGPSGPVFDLVLSPDGKWLASAHEGVGDEGDYIQLWQLGGKAGNQPERRARYSHQHVRDLTWSSDGGRLASVSGDSDTDGSVRLWQMGRESFVWERDSPRSMTAYDIQFSPRDEFIALARHQGIDILDPETGNQVSETLGLKVDSTDYTCIDFSVNGRLMAAGTSDRELSVWRRSGEGASFEHLIEKSAHDGVILDCDFSRDGSYQATCSPGGQIRIWRLHSLPELTLDASLLGDGSSPPDATGSEESQVRSVAFSPDGDFLVAGQANGSVRLWHLGRWSKPLPGLGNVEALDFHPEAGRLAAGRIAEGDQFARGNFSVYDLDAGTLLSLGPEVSIPPRSSFAMRIRTEFSPDGSRVIVFCQPLEGENSVCLYYFDSESGKCIDKVVAAGLNSIPRTAAFSECLNRILLVTSEAKCFSAKFDWRSDRLPVRFLPIEGADAEMEDPVVWDAAISDDGRGGAIVGVDMSRKLSFVRVFDLDARSVERSIDLGEKTAMSVAFHPDGNQLSVGQYDFSINVIEIDEGDGHSKIFGHERGVTALAFDREGTRLASGSKNRVRIWDWETRDEIRPIWAHENLVQAIAWIGSNELVTGAEDGKLKLWRLPDFRPDLDQYLEQGWFEIGSEHQIRWKSDPGGFKAGFVNLPPDSSIGRLVQAMPKLPEPESP